MLGLLDVLGSASFPSLGCTAQQLRRRRSLPGSWATLATRAPLSDPGGATGSKPVRRKRLLLPGGIAFRDFDGVGPHDRPSFEAESRGPRARCLRFVATVARVLLTATQDSLPAGGSPLAGRDFNPLGRFMRFLPWLSLTHASSSPRLLLAHRNSGETGEGVSPVASPRHGIKTR